MVVVLSIHQGWLIASIEPVGRMGRVRRLLKPAQAEAAPVVGPVHANTWLPPPVRLLAPEATAKVPRVLSRMSPPAATLAKSTSSTPSVSRMSEPSKYRFQVQLVAGPKVPAQRNRSSSARPRSEEHTSELQSPKDLVCRLLL